MKRVSRAELTNIVLEKFKKQYLENTGLSETWINHTISRYRKELDDEKTPPFRGITYTEKYLNYDFKSKKVLIVGLGLSYTYVNDLIKKGAIVYGIEPDPKRIDVQYMNAQLVNIPRERIIKGVAEDLPFDDEMFDFVLCFTVLEHVQDVKKALSEMYRVLKKNSGVLFLETPDFRYPYEPHYKIYIHKYFFGLRYLYTFLSPLIQKAIMKSIILILRRPTKYLQTINFLNEKKLKKIFLGYNWRFVQLFFSTSDNTFFKKFIKFRQIQKNLWYYIFK